MQKSVKSLWNAKDGTPKWQEDTTTTTIEDLFLTATTTIATGIIEMIGIIILITEETIKIRCALIDNKVKG